MGAVISMTGLSVEQSIGRFCLALPCPDLLSPSLSDDAAAMVPPWPAPEGPRPGEPPRTSQGQDCVALGSSQFDRQSENAPTDLIF